jgi:hypothetical protein
MDLLLGFNLNDFNVHGFHQVQSMRVLIPPALTTVRVGRAMSERVAIILTIDVDVDYLPSPLCQLDGSSIMVN